MSKVCGRCRKKLIGRSGFHVSKIDKRYLCEDCWAKEPKQLTKAQQLAELKTEFEKRNILIKDNQILGNEVKRKEVQLADLQILLKPEHQFKDVVEKLNKSKDILLFEPRKAIEQFLSELESDDELTSESLIVKILNMQSENERLSKMNDRLSQGIYWGNGEQFCKRISDLKQQLKDANKNWKLDVEELEKDLISCEEKYTQQLKEKDNTIEHYKKQQLIDMQTIETLQLALATNTHQVCEKIRELATDKFDFDQCNECGEWIHDSCVLTKNDFDNILDQIEKGENNEI